MHQKDLPIDQDDSSNEEAVYEPLRSQAGADNPCGKITLPIVLIDRIACNFDRSGVTAPAPVKLAGDRFLAGPFARVIPDHSCARPPCG
ncbi:hypothetical protein A4R29_05490 [Mesorhizobium ciceri biovar biserrulae]|uniref:hypothetical protein n=1 Tax=Mesorhizobium TaxID=68287 RepID=UPI0007A95407|nr:hypothetical protein A4R29_05490 [Mesorhizobium ciceri biovar biserrulae]